MFQQAVEGFLIDYDKFASLRKEGWRGFAAGEHGFWRKEVRVVDGKVVESRVKVLTGVTVQVPSYAPVAVLISILITAMLLIFSKSFYVFGFNLTSFASSFFLTYLYFSFAYRVYKNGQFYLLFGVVIYILMVALFFAIIET